MPATPRKTATKAAQTPIISSVPADLPDHLIAAWGDGAETIEGYEIVPKESLVKVPFLITQVKWRTNARGIVMVDVDAINAAGEPFQFNDSSSGILAQLETYLTGKGLKDKIELEEAVSLRLAVPGGLRGSTFQTKDRLTGKTVQATTYYLTLQRPKA